MCPQHGRSGIHGQRSRCGCERAAAANEFHPIDGVHRPVVWVAIDVPYLPSGL